MGFILLAMPILTVIMALMVTNKKILHALSLLTTTVLLIEAFIMTNQVLVLGEISYNMLGGLFYLDSLSVLFLDIVVVLSFVVSIYSVGYIERDLEEGLIEEGRIRLFYILLYCFIFTMILALTVRNLGIMWIAIEATTLASAFLVGFYNKGESIEAAWKYVIICSVGITIAFLGIVFIHLASLQVVKVSQMLDFTALMENAGTLATPLLRIAFILILVGFGTKAGLAPMHTWLPGAHSQAPSPISALLSGVLLNSAMYAIIRVVSIVNKNMEDTVFTGRALITMGMLSIVMAAVLIISQRQYKSLLAYSSIEHMGIIAIAMGVFTPAAIMGGLLHVINHSFTKGMLFLCAGNILQKYQTGKISRIKGILKALPISGTAFMIGLLAIAGTPPFSVFASEFNIMAAIFADHKMVVGAIFIVLLGIIFSGIVYCLFGMFYGEADSDKVPKGEKNIMGVIAILALLIVISVTGIYLPNSIMKLISQAQLIIMGV